MTADLSGVQTLKVLMWGYALGVLGGVEWLAHLCGLSLFPFGMFLWILSSIRSRM